jgi:hypothetical protein
MFRHIFKCFPKTINLKRLSTGEKSPIKKCTCFEQYQKVKEQNALAGMTTFVIIAATYYIYQN